MNALLAAAEHISPAGATNPMPAKRKAEYAPAAPGSSKHRKGTILVHRAGTASDLMSLVYQCGVCTSESKATSMNVYLRRTDT